MMTPKDAQSANFFDRYYLKINSSEKDTIIERSNKKAAQQAYQHYLSQGKRVVWLGKWVGHDFVDTEEI